MAYDQEASLLDQSAIKTILMVEDDEAIGELLLLTIKEETPYQAVLASSGAEALRLVKSVKPNLFILDYLLSDMTGLELYDQLRTSSGFEHVPAILLTASLEQHEEEMKNRQILGLSKPFELDEFIQTLEQVLA